MPTTERTGLRDRKRAQTSARIHTAAIDLVLRDGLEAATVDAISERADVSSRTFFNYYESKDAAILGIEPGDTGLAEAGELIEAARTGSGEPLALVIRLVITGMGANAKAHSMARHEDRMAIIRQYPELLTGQFAQLAARRTALVEYAEQILAVHPAFGPKRPAPDAQLVLALAGTAVKIAVEQLAANPPPADPARPAGETDFDENELQERAAALITTTVRNLL